MLKQVLQQNGSKAEAKSNQRQRQTLMPRLLVFIDGESSIHGVTYVTRRPATEWMGMNR